MKSTKSYTIHPKYLKNAQARRQAQTQGSASTPTPAPGVSKGSTASTVRTTLRDFTNPVDYRHPYESMGRLAQALALRYDANRTRYSYYRQVRLVHEHFCLDPALLTEGQQHDYFLFVKLQKRWKPKSIRQALAAARQYFVDLLGQADWKVFGQIRTKDHDHAACKQIRSRPSIDCGRSFGGNTRRWSLNHPTCLGYAGIWMPFNGFRIHLPAGKSWSVS